MLRLRKWWVSNGQWWLLTVRWWWNDGHCCQHGLVHGQAQNSWKQYLPSVGWLGVPVRTNPHGPSLNLASELVTKIVLWQTFHWSQVQVMKTLKLACPPSRYALVWILDSYSSNSKVWSRIEYNASKQAMPSSAVWINKRKNRGISNDLRNKVRHHQLKSPVGWA